MPITLYHFTSPDALVLIRQQGIKPSLLEIPRKGPTTRGVVSLTTNPDPTPLMGYTLWDATPLSGDALAHHMKEYPEAVPPIPGPNNCAYTLVVEIPDADENWYLLEYDAVAPIGFPSSEVVNEFIALGGGTPGDWYIYDGVIPPQYIVRVARN